VKHARGVLAQISPSSSSPLPASSSSSTVAQTRSSISDQHLSNLDSYGVTVFKDTLTPPQLIEWNTKTKSAFDTSNDIVWQSGRAYYNVRKRSVHYSDITRVGTNDGNNLNPNDGNTNTKTNSSWWGVFSRKGNNSTESTSTTSSSPTVSLQDVAKSYFKQHGIERYELTELQFLNAFPKSTNQIWHRDNKFKGLTAIVALQDVRTNGPTELILGSHKQNYSLWPNCRNVMLGHLPTYLGVVSRDNSEESISSQPLLGCIDAGDTILYDARTFHRGRGNDGGHDTPEFEGEGKNDRPVLVIRWDAARTPPPGAGLIVTTANKYVGSVMCAALFALRKVSRTFDNDGR